MDPRNQGPIDTTNKFIKVQGVLKKNPNYIDPNGGSPVKPSGPTTLIAPNQALTFTSTREESEGLPLSDNTFDTFDYMTSKPFTSSFQLPTNQPQINGNDVIEGLTNIFAEHEIPLGMINKLIELSERDLTFIVDDSPSMTGKSDVAWENASEYMKNKYRPQDLKACMTRWQEVEDRLHILGQIIKFIPIKTLTITFLNRPADQDFKLDHRGKRVEEFGDLLQKATDQIFNIQPPKRGGTPLYGKLKSEYDKPFDGQTKKMFYVLTDGAPNDSTIQQIQDLIVFRGLRPTNLNQCQTKEEFEAAVQKLMQYAETQCDLKPTQLLSCTNQTSEAAWMKYIEGIAPCTSETDDFHTEREEVAEAQGKMLPYTRGIDLICQLVASINKDDLDALDESAFTKYTLDNYMGRVSLLDEYRFYLGSCPKARDIPASLIPQFENDKVLARAILSGNIQNKLEYYIRNTPHIEPPAMYAQQANNFGSNNQYGMGNQNQPPYQQQGFNGYGNQNQGFNNQQGNNLGFFNQNQQQNNNSYGNQNQRFNQNQGFNQQQSNQFGLGNQNNYSNQNQGMNQQSSSQFGYGNNQNQPNQFGSGNQNNYGNQNQGMNQPSSNRFGVGNNQNQPNQFGLWNQNQQSQQSNGFNNQNQGFNQQQNNQFGGNPNQQQSQQFRKF